MTAQTHDYLSYSGITLRLAGPPLDSWLNSRRHRKLYYFRRGTSANRRGYVGYWTLRDGKLYLAKLLGRLLVLEANTWTEFQTNTLDALFPGHDGTVFASWFSGVLRCPYGNQLRYVHSGYSSVFEFDLFFQIKQGRQSLMWMVRNEAPTEDLLPEDLDLDLTTSELADSPKSTEQTISGLDGIVQFEKLRSCMPSDADRYLQQS